MKDDSNFWVEESNDLLSLPLKRKRNVRSKRLEFIGWGSKPLIEFLQSVGKDTSKKLSQYDVATIITDYVNAHNLSNPERKKKIMCDERLHSLFGKKVVSRIKIYDLLEAHFAENQDSSEDDFQCSSEEDGLQYSREKKASNSECKPSGQKNRVPEIPKSCFAAVIPENIRLVYLKRTLVQDLVKAFESFEDKLLGSFVRIKSDPHDFMQKHSHQLQQVIGVKMTSEAGNASTEVQLQLSNYLKQVHINILSDDNFTEEECDDLRERVKGGLLKRPTVVELEIKARMLHEDITKHWIPREITLLQKRIDRANEKGWRRELYEYLEKKQLLQKPSEQERLLSEIRNVIADKLEPEAMPDALEKAEEGNSSPKTGHGDISDINGTNCIGSGGVVVPSGFIESDPRVHGKENGDFPNIVTCFKDTIGSGLVGVPSVKSDSLSLGKENVNFPNGVACAKYIYGSGLVGVPSAFMNGDSLSHGKENVNFPNGVACAKSIDGSGLVGVPSAFMKIDSLSHGKENVNFPNGVACGSQSAYDMSTQVKEIECQNAGLVQKGNAPAMGIGDESSIETEVVNSENNKSSPGMPPARELKPSQVIELSDDEIEVLVLKTQKQTAFEHPEDKVWFYMDPQGQVQGPFPMTMLKRWSDSYYFSSDFRVWKKGQSQDDAVLLVDALRRMFPCM